MAHITPVTGGEVLSLERSHWHRVFNPHFDTMVSWGYIPGANPVSYGSTLQSAVSGDGEIAFREGARIGYPTDLSASTVYLVSSSASDTGTYSIQGIDANGDYATATVTATGTTAVAVSGTWNHVQRCISTSANNVGTVYVSTKSGAGVPALVGDQIQTVMNVGDNYAINPMLVCPNNQIITVNSFSFSQDVQQAATIRITANRQGMWILNFKFYVGLQDQFEQPFHTPVRLFEGDKLRVSFRAGGGAAAKATFGMNGNVLEYSESSRPGIGLIFGQ